MLDQRRARLVRLSSAKLNQQQIAELQNQTEYPVDVYLRYNGRF